MTNHIDQTSLLVKKPASTLNKLTANVLDVSTLKERLQWAVDYSGLARTTLALKAGLARSHITGMLGQDEPNPTIDALRRIAKAANVSLAWLAAGSGPASPYEGDESTPIPPLPSPPQGELHEQLEASTLPLPAKPFQAHTNHDHLVHSAFEPGRHTFLAGAAILDHLRSQTLELPADVDPVLWVAEWLDVATELQRRREPVTPSAVTRELTRRLLERSPMHVRHTKELNEQVERRLRAEGVAVPTEMPTELRTAQQHALETEQIESDERRRTSLKRPPAPASDGTTPKPPSARSKRK
jgi:transcriptional regulator with XRE-family HTH domain